MSQNKIFTKFISIPIFFFVFSFVFFLFSCSFSLLESVNNDQIVNSQTSSQDLQDVTSVSICPKFNSTSEQTSLSSRSAYPAFSESEISSLKFVMIYNKTLISSGTTVEGTYTSGVIIFPFKISTLITTAVTFYAQDSSGNNIWQASATLNIASISQINSVYAFGNVYFSPIESSSVSGSIDLSVSLDSSSVGKYDINFSFVDSSGDEVSSDTISATWTTSTGKGTISSDSISCGSYTAQMTVVYCSSGSSDDEKIVDYRQQTIYVWPGICSSVWYLEDGSQNQTYTISVGTSVSIYVKGENPTGIYSSSSRFSSSTASNDNAGTILYPVADLYTALRKCNSYTKCKIFVDGQISYDSTGEVTELVSISSSGTCSDLEIIGLGSVPTESAIANSTCAKITFATEPTSSSDSCISIASSTSCSASLVLKNIMIENTVYSSESNSSYRFASLIEDQGELTLKNVYLKPYTWEGSATIENYDTIILVEDDEGSSRVINIGGFVNCSNTYTDKNGNEGQRGFDFWDTTTKLNLISALDDGSSIYVSNFGDYSYPLPENSTTITVLTSDSDCESSLQIACNYVSFLASANLNGNYLLLSQSGSELSYEDSSSGTVYGSFVLTYDPEIYISNSGSTSSASSGLENNPVAFSRALEIINSYTTVNPTWTLYIMDSVEGNFSLADSSSSSTATITATPTKLILASIDSDDENYDSENPPLLCGSSFASSATLAIDTSIPVEIALSITGGKASGLTISENSTVYMTSGSIYSNSTTGNGGGVFNAGNFFMSGSATVGSSSTSEVATDSSYSNYATGLGGGIYNSGNLYIGYTDSDTIDDDFSGGVYYNWTNSQGGGIYTADEDSVKINNATIQYNGASYYGGGVRMGGTGTLILTNSTITKNSASTSGGGLYIGGGATAIITSGSVTENESSSSSAGQDVLVNSSSTTGTGLFEMGDSSVIGKIYLTSGCYITILSTLTGTTPVATITPASYSTSTQVLTLSTDSTTTLENEYEKFSVTSQEDGTSGSVEWSIDSNGYLSSSSGN